MKPKRRNALDSKDTLLQASGLNLNTPNGRVLFRNLNIRLAFEKVAVVGRNGVGKSTLLEVLAGHTPPMSGEIVCSANTALVRQHLDSRPACPLPLGDSDGGYPEAVTNELAAIGLPFRVQLAGVPGLSRGEIRKLSLVAAKLAKPDLLFLDEPTQDLDARGMSWLASWLAEWNGGLMLVSHDPQLLKQFEHFFIVAESGCRYFPGTFSDLETELKRESTKGQKRYIRNLNILARKEQHNATVRRRRERKKNGGRVREIGRAPSRQWLNTKRSYAQKYQGIREKIREQRIDATREWAKATRRALAVTLPLETLMPPLPSDDGHDNLILEGVSAVVDGRTLFRSLDLRLRRDRVAVIGPNGAGKTTLLNIMLGASLPTNGAVVSRIGRIGSIAQGATDWMLEESLLSRLIATSGDPSPERLAQLLIAHKFPLALAERPLHSLSPGERVRAALLCLFQQAPTIEVLVLDEPTYSLDFVGASALSSVINAWEGGLVVASHDREFLNRIGIERQIVLGQ